MLPCKRDLPKPLFIPPKLDAYHYTVAINKGRLRRLSPYCSARGEAETRPKVQSRAGVKGRWDRKVQIHLDTQGKQT
jgi:hypothetical protein